MSHKTDWKPGNVSNDFRAGYDQIDWSKGEAENVPRNNTEPRCGVSEEAEGIRPDARGDI